MVLKLVVMSITYKQDLNNHMSSKCHNIVPLKLLAVVCPALLDHMDKVISQDERHTLPVDPKLPFKVAQEMSKVNVKQLKDKGQTDSLLCSEWLSTQFLTAE